MKRIFLHIDALALKGIRFEDRHRFALGLREELSRYFEDPKIAAGLPTLGDVSQLRAGNVHIAHGARPQQVGAQVVRGIGKEMKR